MDALALLCTLHADGPATLKRLRALGCASLGALLEQDVDALAAGLGVEAPAARRLVREAKLLRQRVGLDALEAEEAPPAGIAAKAEPALRRPEIPESASASEGTNGAGALDETDHDLVARIVAERRRVGVGAVNGTHPSVGASVDAGSTPAPEAAPLASVVTVMGITADTAVEAEPLGAEIAFASAEETVAEHVAEVSAAPADEPFAALVAEAFVAEAFVAEPFVAEPFVAEAFVAEFFVTEAFVAETFEVEQNERVAQGDFAPEASGTAAPAADTDERATGELFVGALPGLDESLLDDLNAAGLFTFADVAGADSLGLTRNLGITYAQARRMRFLARREADSVARAAHPAGKRAAQSAPAPLAAPVAKESVAPARAPEFVAAPAPSSFVALAVAPESIAAPPPIAERAAAPAPAVAPVAPKVEPAPLAPKADVAPLAPKADVAPLASKADVALLAPKADVALLAPKADVALLAPKADVALLRAPTPELEPVVVLEPVAAPEPTDRKAFWESRILAESAAEHRPTVGETVDPSEIEAPPRFGERFARAAAEGRLRRSKSASGRTVLGWNFEIPRPEPERLPFASLGHPAPRTAETGAPHAPVAAARDDGDAAGPFA